MNIPGRVPSSLFGAVLAMAQRRPVFTADYYSVDGSTGKVGAFIDWNDASHTLSQSGGSSLQVAVPAAHADFGGKLCATFTGAEWYLSNRSASAFVWASDGTGLSYFSALTFTSVAASAYVISTRSSTGRGINHIFSTTSGGQTSFLVNNPSGILSPTIALTVANVPRQFMFQYQEAVSPEFSWKITGASATTGNTTAAPSSSAPDTALRLGSYDGTQLYFVGRWRFMAFCPYMGQNENTAMQLYVQQDTGITP